MININELAATPNAFNRYAPVSNFALGPLQTLVNGNSWVGNTGYNLMVVPSPLSSNGFIVLISQLFETHNFEAVPAPVPNRTLANGTEQIGAVKYSQTVAENVSKNILHEETGMWLNQTVGIAKPTVPSNGLEAVNGNLNGQPASNLVTTNPIIRSGTVPHGNTFQAAGDWIQFQAPVSGDVSPYLKLANFPTKNNQLSFLPVFTDGSDSSALQTAYMAEIQSALNRMGLQSLSVNDFINPIGFLNTYANNFKYIDTLAVSTADNLGAVLNVPFERAIAGPQDFICTFAIETIANPGAVGPTEDEVPTYFQLQYLQSIPLLFPNGFDGKAVLFPHWNVNTLIAI